MLRRPEMAPALIVIDGKRYAWSDILKLRRQQRKAARQRQLTLFALKEDTRPASQRTVEGRFLEPLLFERESFGANRSHGQRGESSGHALGKMRRPTSVNRKVPKAKALLHREQGFFRVWWTNQHQRS